MKQQTFIFIGPSGSGKGTQAELLIELLKKIYPDRRTLYIQTGEDLREFVKGDTYTQRITGEMLSKGELIPEFLSVYTWIKHLIDEYDGSQNIIFDGTPRKVHEAGVLDSVFGVYGLSKPRVINIELSREESFKRLLDRKRSDDTEEDIRNRLSWYESSVIPTIEFYRNNPSYDLISINGEQSVKQVFEDIVKATALG